MYREEARRDFLVAAAARYTPLLDGFGETFQHSDAFVPADARIGDALAVRQRAAFLQILAAGDQMRFHHHADNPFVARSNLAADVRAHRNLVLVLLRAVRVARVDHQTRGKTGLADVGACRIDAVRVVVRRLAAAQDDVAVLIAGGPDHRPV